MRRPFRLILWGLLAAGGLALALPGSWLTGRVPVPPLDLVEGGPKVEPVGRLWIDSDAACGAGPRTDPDDCFAILWLVERRLEVVGISTSFGNAPGEVVATRIAVLAAQMRAAGLAVPPIHVGFPAPRDAAAPEPPAIAELQAALEAGPLTILALGPLTNLAAALEGRPDLAGNVRRVVAVMGHEKGHLFHPSEGNRRGAILGHGPIFRDLNAQVDSAAVRAVLALDLPLTLIPYDAGLARSSPGRTWRHSRSRDLHMPGWRSRRRPGWGSGSARWAHPVSLPSTGSRRATSSNRATSTAPPSGPNCAGNGRCGWSRIGGWWWNRLPAETYFTARGSWPVWRSFCCAPDALDTAKVRTWTPG